MVGVTGANASLQYKSETAFKTVNGSDTAKVFGRGQKLASVSIKQNLELIYELGNRIAQKGVFKQFEGSASAEWILANPWWLRFLCGKRATTGSSPYTHVYTISKTLPTMQIESGLDLATDVVRKFSGCALNSVTLSGAVNDLIKVRGDFLFAKEETTGTSFTAATVDTFEPFTFEHATLELPDGTVIAEVQSVELTIANNIQMIWGLGNKEAVAFVPQALDATGRLNVTFKSATILDYVKNRTEIANLELKITNGLAGANERSFSFVGTGILFDEHSTAYEPNVLVLEDVPLRIRDLTITVINNTAPTASNETADGYSSFVEP